MNDEQPTTGRALTMQEIREALGHDVDHVSANRPPVPEGWEFRLSHDRRLFAFYDPGNGPWFVPVPAMEGRFVDSAEMDRLDWYRYVPAEETRREILGSDLNPSNLVLDAQAYRRLRETITATMDDPDRWDRDADEESILSEYVQWLADGKPARDDGWNEETGPDYRLALSMALGLGTSAPWDEIRKRVCELHAAANGSQLPSRPCHEATLNQKVHSAHVYRFQRAESYWCPGMTEDEG